MYWKGANQQPDTTLARQSSNPSNFEKAKNHKNSQISPKTEIYRAIFCLMFTLIRSDSAESL